MYTIIDDRVFWIYFIIILFFDIIASWLILTSNTYHYTIITILIIVSSILLLITTYHISLLLSPNKNNDICFLDRNSQCLAPTNRLWFIVNLLFIILIVLSVVWSAYFEETENEIFFKAMMGIIILLISLIFCMYSYTITPSYSLPFWSAVAYTLIWFCITMYYVLLT
jgi:hypothetical protein